MRAIGVKNLLGQVAYDIVSNLGTLSLNNKTNEFCHRLSHVVLIIQEINNLLDVRALHIADILAIFVHADLQYVKQSLFEVGNLRQLLMVFQKVKTRPYLTLYKVFVHLLVQPKYMNVFFKHTLQDFPKRVLAGQTN